MNRLVHHAIYGLTPSPGVALVLCFLFTVAVRAQDTPVTDRAVKAALVYNFTKVVEWPAGTFPKQDSPITIGVLGQDPAFVATLEKTVTNKFIEKRPLVIQRFVVPADVTECHLLFITDSDRGRLTNTLKAIGGRAILTVSDIPEFAAKGGMIGLELARPGSHFELDVNIDVAKREKLVLSSRLLRLARRIYQEKR